MVETLVEILGVILKTEELNNDGKIEMVQAVYTMLKYKDIFED